MNTDNSLTSQLYQAGNIMATQATGITRVFNSQAVQLTAGTVAAVAGTYAITKLVDKAIGSRARLR